jgi:hypothetical protein
MDEYQRMVSDSASCRVLSFEDMFKPESDSEDLMPGQEPSPFEALQADDFRERWRRRWRGCRSGRTAGDVPVL